MDILKDELLPNVCLTSTSLKNEPNQSKYFKNFYNFDGENWLLFPQWEVLSEHIWQSDDLLWESDDLLWESDDLPF